MQMLHEAHTSRYHWDHIGNAHNFAIGDWQISRVYAALQQAPSALLFARSSLDICQKNGLKDLLPSAYEGMARAYATANDASEARRYLEFARKELQRVNDEEDRKGMLAETAPTGRYRAEVDREHVSEQTRTQPSFRGTNLSDEGR